MKGNDIDDATLAAAVREMEEGLVDASLGGVLYKKRIALPGRGKRGSARTIVATRHEGTWFFLFGFNKNERSTLSAKEAKALQLLAEHLLSLSEDKRASAAEAGALQEVTS
jgi:hypothetical protein